MIRRIVLSAAVLATACACLASPASADPTPMTRAVDAFQYVVDGTDIYYLDQKVSKKRGVYKYTTRLVRKSFVDKSKVVIAEFGSRDDGFADELVAGGGYVYVNLYNDVLDDSEEGSAWTRVVRVSRDGSSKQVVASGRIEASEEGEVVVEGRKAKLNDCGTSVEAMSVSTTGAVVMRATTSERNSKACGRKKNVDQNRYYELQLDGSVREILTTDVRVIAKIEVGKDGSWEGTTGYKGADAWMFSVVGERVLYAYGNGGKLWVKDFTTGAVAGPYLAGPETAYAFQVGTLDFSGRVALFGVYVPKKKVKIVSGIYMNPGDPNSFKQLSEKAVFQFCGSHLVASGATRTLELDPVTLATRRTVATHSRSNGIDLSLGCTNDYLYLSDSRPKRPDLLTAIPLN